MNLKKVAILSLCIVLILSFASCGKKNNVDGQKGNVETQQGDDTKKTPEKDDSVLGDYIFEKMKNDTGVNYELLKDGYGHIAIPYPEDSEITRQASNQIKIFHKQMNTTFFIEYVFITPETAMEDTRQMTPDKLTDIFHWQLKEQTFTIDNMTYQRGVDQSSSKDPGLKEINTDNLIRLRCDYKELHTVASGGDNDYRIACERRYYIYKDDMCVCISAVSEQIDYEYTKEMIDYMVSNIRQYDEDLERSTIPVSIGSDTLNISSLFEETIPATLQSIGSVGFVYKVPDNNGSTMSGAFFSVLDINDKKYKIDESTIDNNEIFLISYPDLEGVTENNDMPLKYAKEEEQVSVLYPLRQHMKDNGYKVSDLYGSNMTIYRIGRGGSYLIEHGDMWTIDEFVALKDGKSYLVIFGYPEPKYDDAVKVINNIVK